MSEQQLRDNLEGIRQQPGLSHKQRVALAWAIGKSLARTKNENSK